MRIPKRVDAVLGWLERHGLALVAAIVLVIVAASLRWQPALATFVLGVALGGVSILLRLSAGLRKVRRENDELLRKNGALRHRITVLSEGVIARGSQMTEALVAIPDGDEASKEAQQIRVLSAVADDPDGP